jgi:hypothetical protein
MQVSSILASGAEAVQRRSKRAAEFARIQPALDVLNPGESSYVPGIVSEVGSCGRLRLDRQSG